MELDISSENKILRDENGRILPGQHSLNPNGRPKGISIKDRVRNWLEDHPDDMGAFVEHFVKTNRDLAWQMLEGKPSQSTDVTSKGEKIMIMPAELIVKNDTAPQPVNNSEGHTQV